MLFSDWLAQTKKQTNELFFVIFDRITLSFRKGNYQTALKILCRLSMTFLNAYSFGWARYHVLKTTRFSCLDSSFQGNHSRNATYNKIKFIFPVFCRELSSLSRWSPNNVWKKRLRWKKNPNIVKRAVFVAVPQTNHRFQINIDYDQILTNNSERTCDVHSNYEQKGCYVPVCSLESSLKKLKNVYGQ